MKIHLINGESYLLINEKINEITDNSNNITLFDLNINTLEEVIVEAGYFSLFEDEKYIVVRNSNFFGTAKISDNDNTMLINYLENPNNNTTIIFVCNEKIDMRKKICKVIKEKFSLIEMPNLKYYEIEKRLLEYFNKQGFKIENESIKYIVSNSLNNYDCAMNEANKVFLYYDSPTYITYEDVVNIVSVSLNDNNFLFVDAVVDNDLKRSLKLLNDLKIMKVDATILLSLLARDFRIMYNVKVMLSENIREYAIMNELTLLDWQLDKYMKKAFTYKEKELEGVLKKLAKLDLEIKSGKIDKYVAVELFILDICE